MMSQNRQSEIDHRHAEHDHRINVKAELEIELLDNKIDALREREILQLITIIRRLSAHLAPELVAAIETEAAQGKTKLGVVAFLRSNLPMTGWRQPGFGYGRFDEVLLTLVTLRAGKRPQVLVPHARLDRGQSHGKAASGAQRPLVLFVEHQAPLYVWCERSPGSMLDRRSQPGRHPVHRMGLCNNLVDVIAHDALKNAPLESGTRRLDGCQVHWARAFRTEMRLNCDAAWIEQDC